MTRAAQRMGILKEMSSECHQLKSHDFLHLLLRNGRLISNRKLPPWIINSYAIRKIGREWRSNLDAKRDSIRKQMTQSNEHVYTFLDLFLFLKAF